MDLAMWGVDLAVPLAPPTWRMSGGLAHQMTSFGHALTEDLYLRAGEASWRIALREYLSRSLVLPGLEVEWVRVGIEWRGERFELTPGAMVWLQPARGRWDDGAATPGGQVRLRWTWLASARLSAFAGVAAKTPGWVAGTVLLGAGVEGRVGLGARL